MYDMMENEANSLSTILLDRKRKGIEYGGHKILYNIDGKTVLVDSNEILGILSRNKSEERL